MIEASHMHIDFRSIWQRQSVNRRILAALMTVGGFTLVVNLAATVKELVVARQFGTADTMDTPLNGRRLEWRDTQFKRSRCFEKGNLRNPLIRKLKHLIFDPLDVVDQPLLPIYERYQMISKTYGIASYVAKRG